MPNASAVADSNVFVFHYSSPWLAWAMLAGAVLFAAGLAMLLVLITRRSGWPDRK